MWPSHNGVPALIKSPSCTKICFVSGTRYFFGLPDPFGVTMISLFPRLIFGANDTTPSISETTAGFEGLRASNNSVTRGKPPVISPVFPNILGIFAIV